MLLLAQISFYNSSHPFITLSACIRNSKQAISKSSGTKADYVTMPPSQFAEHAHINYFHYFVQMLNLIWHLDKLEKQLRYITQSLT